jgi:uncharacterized protein (DUF952 family)
MNALLTILPTPSRPLWPIRSEIIYVIYKVCDQEAWAEARARGVFTGAPVDHEDGYIHFSTAGQLAETLEKHFAGREGLVLLAVPIVRLGDDLQWETSRGGDLFPHLYAELPVSAVVSEQLLDLDASGKHILPGDL